MQRFRRGFGGKFRRRFQSGAAQQTLSQMQNGQSGTVVEIRGGGLMLNRLSALGIRPGQRLTKVSAMFMRGPVTVQLGGSQVAIGHGMTRRIIVKPDGITE